MHWCGGANVAQGVCDQPDRATGSKVRQHADAVLKQIIEPAAKKLEEKNIDLQVVRGEHDQSGKAILAEILDGILHYDLVIAVLFEPNPNVFYEVGVAESAGRPMLVLKHSDFPIPHDLKDVRYVEYTSRDLGGFRALDPMRADGPGALLSAAMEQRVGAKRYKWPFDRELLAALGQQNILSRFRDLTPLDWSKIILEAEKEVWLAGVTLKQLCESPAFHFPDADGDVSRGAQCLPVEASGLGNGARRHGASADDASRQPRSPAYADAAAGAAAGRGQRARQGAQ